MDIKSGFLFPFLIGLFLGLFFMYNFLNRPLDEPPQCNCELVYDAISYFGYQEWELIQGDSVVGYYILEDDIFYDSDWTVIKTGTRKTH